MASSAEATHTAAHAFVLTHLGDAIAAFPPQVRASLVAKFVADYHEPLTAQLECVLRKRLTDDEVRHVLFAPTPLQYRFYADLLSLRGPCSDETRDDPTSWQVVVRKRFLTLFYLKHARNWPLVVEFILRDGLQILVDLFLHTDLQMRGQAIDSFVQITSNPTAFEWFDAPVGYQARALHAKMVALATPGSGFLPRVVANIRLYEEPDERDESTLKRLPGATFVLLQVLAFFLSWVRKFYTPNELRLSRELLDLLREWAQRTRSDNEDELTLAQQVYEDFSRWPAIEDGREDETERDDNGSAHIELSIGDTSQSAEVFSAAQIDAIIQQAENDEDTALESLDRAIALCTEAIDADVNVAEARLGRARARLKRIHVSKASGSSMRDEVQLCLSDCAALLESEPENMDAWRCQLGVLETAAMWSEGRDVLDAWHMRQEDAVGGFLAEDVAYLLERRAFFDEQAYEQQQRLAEERRLHATREAKEQQVYRLLLQRTQSPNIATPKSVAVADEQSLNEQKWLTTTKPSTTRDVLARFRSSTTTTEKKRRQKESTHTTPLATTDAPLDGVVKARSFVRKFAKCKRDALAVRSLLRSTGAPEVVGAMETALPEESLPLVLEALVMHPEDEELANEEAASLAHVLRSLLSLPRFALMREMASPEQQQHIDDLVTHGQEVLATALGA